MSPTPWRKVRKMLDEAGIRPKKFRGQHFLTDSRALDVIENKVREDVPPVILEVGAGPGVLTERLVNMASEVIAVEIDPRLADFLSDRFAGTGNLHIITGDIFEGKNRLRSEVLKAVRVSLPEGGEYHLVANLPYNIGTPVVVEFMLLPEKLQPSKLLVMLQKELAEKLLAASGSDNYGPPSIARSLYGSGEIIRRVPGVSFYPPTKVESVVFELRKSSDRRLALSDHDRKRFMRFVRDVFTHRRKTARKVLRLLGLDSEQARSLLDSCRIDYSVRFETLSTEKLLQLWNRKEKELLRLTGDQTEATSGTL